jgi:hypothetical protein
VFEDRDGDGLRGTGEPGVPGVVVQRGFEVAVTDAAGDYTLEGAADARGSSNDGIVWITRPAGYDCATWYREIEGDGIEFALVPRPPDPEDGFTFVQISDAHVFDRWSDFIEFSSGPRRWWIPELARSAYMLYVARRMNEPQARGAVVAALRADLAGRLGEEKVASLWDVQLPGALLEEIARGGGGLPEVEGTIRAAFDELRSLEPAFVVSTGDLVLESNNGSAEAVLRWMRFYRELTSQLGFPVYDTIGNNEIAGINNDEFPSDDPRFAKGLFRQVFGPSHYSFDRGRFHFVALDTHSRRRVRGDPRKWFFNRPEKGFWTWLDRDLDANQGRLPVLLNHEPFLRDPSWSIDEDDFRPVRDDGRLARHRVPVVVSGHVHRNGLVVRDGTTHITTGALSGFRWALPADAVQRGYRLFHAKGERLYSAWKRLGHPVVAFVDPPGDPVHHPASGGGDAGEGAGRMVVAVAADVDGPFPGVRLLLDGRPLPIERWGRYFVAARVPEDGAAGPGELVVQAISLDGRLIEDRAVLARAATADTADLGAEP